MRSKNISIKNTALIIILFVCSVFCEPNINLVSPYIINGFSQTYSVSLNPKKFTGVYEADSASGEYEILQSYELFETQMFNIFGIKERFEIGFGGIYFNSEHFFRLRLRTAFKLYEKGNNNLFENIVVAPFGGISISTFNNANELLTDVIGIRSRTAGNELWLYYAQSYIGLSIGTKKQEKDGNSFELFSSILYLYTKYDLRNDLGHLGYDYVYKRFHLSKHEISIPIGFRKVYFANTKIISIKSGIGFHFAFPNSNMDFKYSEALNYAEKEKDSLFYKISYLSAFAEIGFHFGARKIRKQQEEQLNFDIKI